MSIIASYSLGASNSTIPSSFLTSSYKKLQKYIGLSLLNFSKISVSNAGNDSNEIS